MRRSSSILSEKSLTSEQESVVSASLSSQKLMVNSLAGTGKSSTALACVRANLERNPDMRIGYLCFNSANAKEMQAKGRSFSKHGNFQVSTLHGLAWRDFSEYYEFLNKDLISPKPWDIKDVCEFKTGRRTKESVQNYARKLALDYLSAFCHSTSMSIDDFFELPMNRKIRYGVEEIGLDVQAFRKETAKLWRLFAEEKDFPGCHDVYLKLFHLSLGRKKRFDLLIVDEAQDLFPVTEDIVRKISSQDGRLLLFGDRYQQIYAWNNSINSMQHFDGEADILELTQSFRCPQNVVDEAGQYLKLLGFKNTFRAASNAPLTDNFAIIARSNSGVFVNLAEAMKKMSPKEIWIPGGHNADEFQMIRDCVSWKLKKFEYVRFKALLSLNDDKDWKEYAKETNDREMDFALKAVNGLSIPKTIQLLEMVQSGAFSKSPDKANLCITTAHRSKGLQFGYVDIFADFENLIELGNQSKEERESEFESFRREMSPETEEYIRAMPEMPVLYDAEELRLAYVALTRSLGGLESGSLHVSSAILDKIGDMITNDKLVLLDKDIYGNWVLFDNAKWENKPFKHPGE